MTDNVTNDLLLEHLTAIQSKMDRMAEDIPNIKSEMRRAKGHMASLTQSDVGQDNSIAALKARLDRIERRLELSE